MYQADLTIRLKGYCETSNGALGVSVVERCAARDPMPMSVSSDGLPLMGSEDFGYYLKERKGCFFIVGTREERQEGLAAMPFDAEAAARVTGLLSSVGTLMHGAAARVTGALCGRSVHYMY